MFNSILRRDPLLRDTSLSEREVKREYYSGRSSTYVPRPIVLYWVVLIVANKVDIITVFLFCLLIGTILFA